MPSDDGLGANPSRTNADRNLLFGIIALQTNFISREQLVAAFDAWVQDKARTLAKILERQGALPAVQREVIEKLVDLFVEKHGGDAEKSLAALSRPTVDLEVLKDPDLKASLGHVGAASDPRLEETIPVTSGRSLGRFRILRLHAKGGLGQVSVAIDQELNREVALKEIQPCHADHAVARERFVLEAEITGGLEHPGIVPVYALGQAADGRPFYAMRFVKGDSLKEAIEIFHKPDNPNRNDAGARQLALRQLLGRFIDVCNAMEYAHSRGVLHRDLKPGNIMVGKYGETLVVDWGLAKVAGKKEIVSDEATLRPSSALSSSGQTQPGSAVGTPSYMSPEQAAGKLEELGPASDVYSLGATLYHVLCGRPPFEKEGLAEILAKVERGYYPKPRSVVAEIPAALEAICLKAMSLKPADRYQTARSLADDLEHWLADEPVRATPDSLVDRVNRFSRRHRGYVRAGAVAAVLAIMLIGAVVALHMLNEQRTKALMARDDAILVEQAQKKAKENAVVARDQAILSQMKATTAEKKAVLAREKAVIASNEASEAQMKETQAKFEAVVAAEKEKKAKIAALNAKAAQEYEAYVAEIGLADSKIRAGAFDDVRDILKGIENRNAQGAGADEPMLRGWEFARLQYLAGQAQILLENAAVAGDPATRDNRVEALALTPDGKWYVAGRMDGTFAIGSTSDRDVPIRVVDNGKPIFAVAISPDGKLIAIAGEPGQDGSVQLWTDNRQKTEKVGKAFAGGKLAVYCVQFAERNGKTWLVTAGADKTAQVWNVGGDPQQPQLVGKGSLTGHFAAIRRVVISRDASLIVTVGDDNRAVIWDLNEMTGQFEWNRIAFELHQSAILAAAIFSSPEKPRDTRIVTADVDGQMLIWSPLLLPLKVEAPKGEKGKVAQLPSELEGHDKAVHVLAFSDDGKYVLSGSNDNTVKLQRVEERSEIRRSGDVQIFRGHGGWVRGGVIGSLAAGQQAADANLISLNNGFIVSGSHDGTVRRWNTSTYREELLLHDPILTHSTGTDRDVLPAVFSPDGRTVLTGGRGHKGYLWDIRPGENLTTDFALRARLIEEGHDLPIWTAVYSPRGDWLVTAGTDDQALLWNTSTGTQFARIERTGILGFLAVSPDGQWIATSFSEPRVGPRAKLRFWKLKDLKNYRSEPARRSAVQVVERQNLTALAFAPDGRHLYSGFDSDASSICGGLLWELRDDVGNPEWVVVKSIASTVRINAAIFLPDGDRLITADEKGDVWQHDLVNGDRVASRKLVLHGAPVRTLAIHPNGKSLLTLGPVAKPVVGSRAQTEAGSYQIRRWDLETAAEIKKPIQIDTCDALTLAISPQGDEALVVAAGKNPSTTAVHRYDLESGAEIKRDEGSYLDSERMDKFGSADGRQYWGAIYAPATAGAQAGQIVALHGTQVELLNETGHLVNRYGTQGGALFEFEFLTGQRNLVTRLVSPEGFVQFLPITTRIAFDDLVRQSNPQGHVKSVSFSSDGRFLLTAGSDDTIKVWDAITLMARCQILNPHGEGPSSIYSATFSSVPGSYQILSAGRDKSVKLWNWDGKDPSPALVSQLKHDSNVRSAAFSHDAVQIACGCEDGTVWVWKATDLRHPLRKTKNLEDNDNRQEGHTRAVRHIAFANGNDEWIVTAADDNLAYVWKNGESLTAHAVLKGHAAAVRSVAFSPTNDRIVTGSDDTFAKIWDPRLDLPDGEPKPYAARELLTLSRHRRAVTAVAFSPGDGAIVLTASNDGDTVLWLSKQLPAVE